MLTKQEKDNANSELSEQCEPSLEGWGWELDSDSRSYIPAWKTLHVASNAYKELGRCGSKSARGCSDRTDHYNHAHFCSQRWLAMYRSM